MNDATKAASKQLRDALTSCFGREFGVKTHVGMGFATFRVYCPKSRVDMDRLGFSEQESAELGNALGLHDFEPEFVIPNLLVPHVLKNLATSTPVNLIDLRCRALAGQKI